MVRIPSHPDADHDLEQAALFYDEHSAGLGDDFLDEFEYTFNRIIAHPTRYREVRGQARHLRLRRIPFDIVYEIYGGDIYVLALAHVRRRPFYWRQRYP